MMAKAILPRMTSANPRMMGESEENPRRPFGASGKIGSAGRGGGYPPRKRVGRRESRIQTLSRKCAVPIPPRGRTCSGRAAHPPVTVWSARYTVCTVPFMRYRER